MTGGDAGDLLDRCLAAVAAREHEVHAFTESGFERARAEADAAFLHARWPDPGERTPLFGLPVGIKDIFHVEGRAIRAGSALPPEAFAGPEAEAVRRLRGAGALVMGITVTAEFACWAPGPTRNPRNLGHTPGGSSSGSAAGVAAGFFPLALGSQTAGSVIRPAAFCGVVGVKPGFGRIPTDGMVGYAASLDQVGLFADTVERAEAALAVLCDGWVPHDGHPGCPVLGVPSGRELDAAAPRAQAVFDATVECLRDAGWRVVEAPLLDDVPGVCAALDRLSQIEMAEAHRPWWPRWRDLYHPSSAAEIEAGLAAAPGEADRLRERQRTTAAAMAAATVAAGIDFWLSPAATDRAPEGLGRTGDPAMNSPWTFVGWPAATLPCAVDADGLPYGLQITAPRGRDEDLLAACRLLAPLVAPG